MAAEQPTQSGQMQARASRLPWLGPFIVIVLIVVGAVALYVTLYALKRADDAKSERYKALGLLAREVQAKNKVLAQVVVNAVWQKECLGICAPDKIKDRLKAAHVSIQLDSLQETTSCKDAGSPISKQTNDNANAGLRAQVQTWIKPVKSPGDPRLRFFWCVEGPNEHVSVAASAPLRDLVPWELVKDQFDGLIVQTPPNASNDGGGDRVMVPFFPGVPDALARTAALTQTDAVTGAARLQDPFFGDLTGRMVGDIPYKTFEIPAKFYLPPPDPQALAVAHLQEADTSAEGIDLELIGLVRPEQLREQALALSPASLIWVAAGVAAAFLALPYLKVRFMARRERLREVDMWLLGAAAFSGASVAMLLVLELHGHATLRAQIDDGMHELADQIHDHLKDEVGFILQQLNAGGRQLAMDRACLKQNDQGRGLLLLDEQKRLPDDLLPYPDFEALFCTDTQGVQVQKWMPRTTPTQMISVKDEPFFAKTLSMPETPNADEPGFVFDSISAGTTGLHLAVFAMPIDGRAAKLGRDVPQRQRTGVAILATRLRSLRRAVVPFPYGYVVLNDQGKVLFRSEEVPNLSEEVRNPSEEVRDLEDDFFAQVKDVPTLRYAVATAGPEGSAPGDWRYRGNMHRMQAFKLNELPATLIVFYDKAIVEGVSAEVFLNCLFWVALLGLVCMAAAVLVRVQPGAFDWIWPTVRHWRFYAVGCAASIAFAATLAVAVPSLPVWLRPYVLLFAPATWIVAASLLARSSLYSRLTQRPGHGDPGQAWRRRLHPNLYILSGVLGLVALAAVPAMLFYQDVVRGHHAAFEHLSATSLADMKAEQAAADAGRFIVVPDTCAASGAPASNDDLIAAIDERCGEGGQPFRDLAARRDGRIFITASRKARLEKTFGSMGFYEPQPPRTVTAAPPREPAASCSGLFTFGARGALPLSYFSSWSSACLPAITALHVALADHLQRLDATAYTGSHNASDRTEAQGSALVSVWIPLALIALCAWPFVRSVATHILGLEFEDDGVLDRSADVMATESRFRWLLLRPTAAELERLKGLFEPIHRLDLGDAGCKPEGLASRPADEPLLILRLESRLGDPIWRPIVLRLLSSPPDRRLVISTAIDPVHYLAERLKGASDDQKENLTKELAEWALVAATLDKARYALPQTESGAPTGNSGQISGADPVLIQRLDDESKWNDVLRLIQRDLLSRTDFVRSNWCDVIEYVQDMAEPYYRIVWNLCSEEEKLTLIQLAQEGVVNPRAFDVLRRLRRRRLVCTEPRFRIMNESFKRFVLEAEPPAQVKQWEKPLTGQTWARLRTPLLALLFIATVLLFYTQQPFFNSVLAIVGTGAAALSSVTTVVARARDALKKGSVPT